MNLLVDAGNTRLKWACHTDAGLADYGESVHRGRSPDEAVAPLAAIGARPERVLIANVGGSGLREPLAQLARERFGVSAEFAVVEPEGCGIRIAYTEPGRLGVDRWLAMIGGFAAEGGPLLVVDAGTAVTVDAVEADGRHLGGLIAPGERVMRSGLLRATADIRDDGGDAPWVAGPFAADTGDAVRAGAMYALAGLIERCADELAERCGSPGTILLTGGDASALKGLVRYATALRPDLVLQGLAVYADNRRERG